MNVGIVKRSGGREAEGGGLLNRYTFEKAYRGFESLPLCQQHFVLIYQRLSYGRLERGMEILTKPFPMRAPANKVREMLG